MKKKLAALIVFSIVLLCGCTDVGFNAKRSADDADRDSAKIFKNFGSAAEKGIKIEPIKKKEEARPSPTKDLMLSRSVKNPFLTLEEIMALQEQERQTIEYLNLSAVFLSPGGTYAIVDGRIVKEKDMLDNKEVVKIDQEEIILKDALGEYIVKIK